MGRLTRDPDIKYTQASESMCIARYTLAVDRRRRKDESGDSPNADFISCVAFGKAAEFAEKYFRKGIKITISGRIQTGSYVNKDGVKIYTTDVVVEDQEFAESKGDTSSKNGTDTAAFESMPEEKDQDKSVLGSGFTNVHDAWLEDLPFT